MLSLDHVSLPLMGIGNPVAGTSATAASSNSLPLMGIGNRRAAKTPRHRSGSHYPSWGLETRTALASRAYRRPHYPSWGLETVVSSIPAIYPGMSHYPSWGLETRVVVGNDTPPVYDSLPLMGIGNVRMAPITDSNKASHYPSWGLETSPTTPTGRVDRNLITPHGDWKRDLTLLTADQRALITPHGDWKPSWRQT